MCAGGARPKEWSDRLEPDNPDWICGDSGRTGLACGLCRQGTALSAGKVCESCGDDQDLWLFQLFACSLALFMGNIIMMLILFLILATFWLDPQLIGVLFRCIYMAGGALWYMIVWKGIFFEEHDQFQDGRTNTLSAALEKLEENHEQVQTLIKLYTRFC